MTRRWKLAALALAALLAATTAKAAPSPHLDLSADRCPFFDTVPADQRSRVRCGYLDVPEDYAKPGGRRIELAVAIVEPKSNKPADPVVMLHGGPGAGDMGNYRFRLGEPLGPRTLIMFDQRGVGQSRPQLCPELGEAIFAASVKGLPPDGETAELVAAHNRCHDRLVEEKFDLTKYNTDATVADMEALRTALGFEHWKVYGVSYGTAVGLAYLRDHADRISALVLDSVYPLDAPPASKVVVNMMRSLKELSDACAAQPACKVRFGDVETSFLKTIADLTNNPIEVPALGATADWTDAVRISAPAFMTVVHQLLYDHTAYPALPYLIDRIAARDGKVFALLVDQFHERAVGITHGGYAAVECYERFPFDSRDAYEMATAEWPAARDQMTLITRHFDICANWGVRAAGPMTMPGHTDVPTLVLAGLWDPITPPAYSKRTAELLGAHYVELPYHGHGVRGDKTCGAPIIRAFLDQPARAADTSCTQRRAPPLFATSLIRAPLVAQQAAAWASGKDPTSAPAAASLVTLLGFLFLSLGLWTVIGALRAVRLGTQALSGLWYRPGAPLGLAGVAILAGVGGILWSFVSAAASASPILLMIGLPGSSLPLFVLPWLGVILLGWTGWTLLFGRERAERPLAYAIHLWAVFLAAIASILLIAWLGLLVPDLI